MDKQTEYGNLQAQLKELDVQRQPIVNRMKEIQDELLVEKYSNFELSLKNILSTSAEELLNILPLRDKVLKYFDEFDFLMANGGYNPSTDRLGVSIKFHLNTEVMETVAEIKQVLPHLYTSFIEVWNENTKVDKALPVLKIRDRYLSEGGIFQLAFNLDDNTVLLLLTVRGRTSLVKEGRMDDINFWKAVQTKCYLS